VKPPRDRDADLDLETLKRALVAPAARVLDVCVLYFRKGRSAREIAAKMAMQEKAVRSVIHRARRKVRDS
jgi:DNA-directed RNA polymerase specialized sigma24 family protein